MPHVFRSAIINAPAGDVWSYIRDFNALPKWHPAIATSEIENGRSSDSVGCVRRFTRKSDGGLLRETLLALSDAEMSFTYDINDSPMPVANYTAGMRLIPITMGNTTLAQWWAEFDVTDGTDEATAHDIGENVFVAAFASLNQHFATAHGKR